MGVNLNKKAKNNEAESDGAKSASPVASGGKYLVMLGNKCQRYLMTAHGDKPDLFYEAGKEYAVTKSERDVLFQLTDEFGVRFFYDAAFIKKREAARLARAQAAMGGGRQLKAGEDSSRVMMDEDGNDIGTAGSVDDVGSEDETVTV